MPIRVSVPRAARTFNLKLKRLDDIIYQTHIFLPLPDRRIYIRRVEDTLPRDSEVFPITASAEASSESAARWYHRLL